MKMAEELNMPTFLEGRDFDSIMEEMISDVPADIDMSEGSHPYNLLAPTARQEEYFAQFLLAEAIHLIFPKFCEGYPEYVDYHAEINGMSRKEATYAMGELSITGAPLTVIPEGTIFSTTSVNDVPSVEFQSVDEGVIGEDGTSVVKIQAVEPGTTGNVSENTIILQDSPIDGVESLTNPQATSGGIDEENDASLIERIAEYEEMQGLSFVGNDTDYKRWAEEVNGTGVATVVPPAEDDDSGTITIVLTDTLGKPATEELCRQVYDYIVSPNDRDKRKAPVNGAKLSVIPPVVVNISVTATIKLEDGIELEAVKAEFLKNITAYMTVVPNSKEVKYTKVGSIIAETNGVLDYSYFTLNGGKSNVSVAVNEFPQVLVENVHFYEYVAPIAIAQMTVGKKLNYDTGVEETNDKYMCSDPIPVVVGKRYWIDNSYLCYFYVISYDANGNFVDHEGDIPNTGSFSIKNQNIAYIRLSSHGKENDPANRVCVYDKNPTGAGEVNYGILYK